MTDYKNLVKFLRGLSPWAFPEASNKRMQEAADSIEKLVTLYEKAEIDATNLTGKLAQAEAQLSKRGEWIKRREFVEDWQFDGFRCSICNWWKGDFETYNYCPKCGAKMERLEKEVSE